jgi:SAM-dependent methyltransferase
MKGRLIVNFIVLSSCPWGSMLQRPHHMARELAKAGHTVTFIEPSHRQVPYNSSEITMSELLFLNLKESRIVSGVTVISPVAKINEENVAMYSNQVLCKYLLKQDENNKNVILTYLPSYINVINQLDETNYSLVYDCVDDHNDLEFSYWSSKNDIENEILMLNKAEIVLTTSSSLFLNKSFGRTNVYLSKNAVNLSDFNRNDEFEPDDLKNIPKPRVCYVGAIDKWFDTELFYKIVKSNPDKSFIVIGPQNGNIIDKEFDNLYLIGVKPHSKLKYYLNNMDVGIIPFRDDIELIINCDPIKLYEYLSCNIPVVSTGLPDLCINKDFIAICGDYKEFSDCINKFINTKFDERDIQNFLYGNTWRKRAEDLIDILENKIDYSSHKAQVLNEIQKLWEAYLQTNDNPIIRSLLGLSYAEIDKTKFYGYCKNAYESKESMFALKNYIISLYENGNLTEACNIVIESPIVNEIDKAELILQMNNKNDLLTRIHLFYCIREYESIRELISLFPHLLNEEKSCRFELANYYVVTGRYKEALEIYNKLLDTYYKDNSPLFNWNLKVLLGFYGLNYEAQKAHFKSIELTDKLLKRNNRFTEWQKLFTEIHACNNCGETNTNLVMVRPDGQKIVSCAKCGQAYLEKFPEKSKLNKIYDLGYYTQSQIVGYSNNYFNEKKDYIFKPRLEWINNTTTIYSTKRILDIGCSDGEFLEYAMEFGWEPYGIEISQESFSKACEKRIMVYNQELRETKFPDNYFDCVTLWDVIEHYISPKQELNEIYRILKPNGKLFISTPNHRKGIITGKNWFGYNASYEHLFYFEPATLINMLISVGFKIDDCFTHDIGDWTFKSVSNVGHVLLLSARK